jgi:ribosomal protein S18 acetylase RimI-like enzyme
VNIRELAGSDVARYRALMMRGLQEHPAAFRISPKDEGEPLVPFASAPAGDFTLGAFGENDELLGVLSFQRETRLKLRHKGTLFRMYVRAEATRQGVGRSLLREAIRRATQLEGLEQLNLTVVSTNSIAKALYASFGFESFALERNGVKNGGTYLDEEQMCARLGSAARH